MMLISELWQGSVTAWRWPHRDIPCHHDTSLRWSPPQLTPRIHIVISDAGTTPRALGATTNNKMRIRSWKQIVSSGRGDWVLTLASLQPESLWALYPLLIIASLMLAAWTRRRAHVILQTVTNLQFGFGEQIHTNEPGGIKGKPKKCVATYVI